MPALVEEYGPSLAEYYEKRSATRYAKTGLAVYRVYERLIAGGLKYHGFVDLKNGLALVNSTGEADTLWGCDKSLKIVRLFLKSGAGEWTPAGEAAPFTPVFAFAADPDKVLSEVTSALDADPASPEILGRMPKTLYSKPE